MKMLTVFLLVCAVAALSEAGGERAEAGNGIAPEAQGNSERVKRRASCPGGWTSFGCRCFHYVPTAMTWALAEKNCLSMGGHLASVHSADEHHGVQSLISSASRASGPTWLGGTDAQEAGIWFWSDGSAFNYRYTGGFDDYDGEQRCLQMNYGANKDWDDTWCSTKLPSVCAKDP